MAATRQPSINGSASADMLLVVDDEFRAIIPPLRSEEREQLERNLVQEGCRDALVAWRRDADPVLLDGHNRREICERLGIEYRIEYLELADRDSAKLWIIANQAGRRNLTDFQRAELALVAKPIIEARARSRMLAGVRADPDQNSGQGKTDRELAARAGVSHDTIGKVETILAEQPSSNLLSAVRAGEVSINAAADIATLSQDKQVEVMVQGRGAWLTAAKEVRAARARRRRTQRMEKIAQISRGDAPLLQLAERYPVIYCDPPWRYDYVETESRAIENQYPTLDLQDIMSLPVQEIAFDDCVLYMWATSPKLADAMEVLPAWGFTYRTCAVWDKRKLGMGYYFRQQHELLLVATRGEPPTPLPENRPSSVFAFERGEHSVKPVEVYEFIEAMYPELPKLEMFSRSPRTGWGAWGNQAERGRA
ncbi:N6-adenosine-specific RNA methylase IME4 [Variovorax sp. HW608]|uniref:MT-A70 family methyltransferase n=1 Tax=Variovorax sp. HW608 TaxID=1034889 RepID=UPI00081FAE86|nr:MT-A70 family methyltransferase [Variovorax sp. HW608]SCK49366.1 N6-adenosine-specific RNA methylase IME4 [Variovorax sp. HW608]